MKSKMRSSIACLLVVSILNLYCPVESFANPAPAKKVKTSNDKISLLAEYDSPRIKWKVVFSMGGGNVNRDIALDVGSEDAQILMSVTNLNDPSAPVKNVSLIGETPDGKSIGKGKSEKDETTALGLTTAQLSPQMEKIRNKIEEKRKVESEGPDSLLEVATEEEWKAAAQEQREELKKAKNAGLLFLPPERLGGEGLSAFYVVNPTKNGKWKMKVKGAKGEPFIAVALALPLELTDADQVDMKQASVEIVEAIRSAFPEYQLWDETGCNSCKWILSITGFVPLLAGTLVSIIGWLLVLALSAIVYIIIDLAGGKPAVSWLKFLEYAFLYPVCSTGGLAALLCCWWRVCGHFCFCVDGQFTPLP